MKKHLLTLFVSAVIVPLALLASDGDHVLKTDDPMYSKVVAAANASLKKIKRDWGMPIEVRWNDSTPSGFYYIVFYQDPQKGDDDPCAYYVTVTKDGDRLVANPRIGRS